MASGSSTQSDVFVEENKSPQPSFITRTILPSTRVPKTKQSVWSILKSAIGKDLSRLTTPVVFNEPLSFIQRLAEYMENVHLLFEAANLTDPCERLERVGAFASSNLSSQRLTKPFNPLLLETYVFEKPNMGFRFVAEQVSHHPPISAFHASALNGEFEFFGNVAPKLRFWGRSLECDPQAHFTVKIPRWKEVYTWKALNISIYNLIFGQMYMALKGTLIVKCDGFEREFRLDFKGAGKKSGPELLVTGEVVIDKKKVRSIYGNFCNYLASCSPNIFDQNRALFEDNFRQSSDEIFLQAANIVIIKESQLLWTKYAMPPNCQEYYDFSYMAIQLNELSEDLSLKLPRTDSRFRPDVRCMENGAFDEAANQKQYLEEKQRAVAKKNLNRQPRWFNPLTTDEFGRQNQWQFTGAYWEQNFDECDDIF